MEETESLLLFTNIFGYSVSVSTPIIKSIEAISSLLSFIKSKDNDATQRVKHLDELTEVIKENRLLAEYFTSIDNESIYIHLIDLFLEKEGTGPQLKASILKCIAVLILNIETPKAIYEYIYQKLSILYRNNELQSRDLLNDHLILLNQLHGDTQFMTKPRNYFSFGGIGKMEVDIKKSTPFTIGYVVYFALAFKIAAKSEMASNASQDQCELIHFECNNQLFSVELHYPVYIVIPRFKQEPIKVVPLDEWISLVFVLIVNENQSMFYLSINGDKELNKYTLTNFPINHESLITSMSFFEGFIGEVTSVTIFSQKERRPPCILNQNVLGSFMRYKEGLWKKSIRNSFHTVMSNQSKMVLPANLKKSLYQRKKTDDPITICDDIVLMITPYAAKNDILEDSTRNTSGRLVGFCRLHKYYEFQKRITLLGGINCLLPIAEMIILNQNVLCEDIVYNYLELIYSILKDKKHNMKDAYQCEFFTLLSLFIEKIPSPVFTEKILMKTIDIGKVLFSEPIPELCPVFFENILLNEKILSKFSQELHIKFWAEIYKFCQSDITQIEGLMNMKKVCLILRYYDETKYHEMCCEKHFNQFKPEYAGNKIIMSPPMSDRVTQLKEIMILIMTNLVNPDTSETPSTLFSLLTLDLSPCLTEFIIQIFIKAIETNGAKLAQNLFNNNFSSIIANTFRHSLLGERIIMLHLVFKITNEIESSPQWIPEKHRMKRMLKSCFIPDTMFYARNSQLEINEQLIKDISLHCVNKFSNKKSDSCDLYNKDITIVLNDDEYEAYLNLIHKKLLYWILGYDLTQTDTEINYEMKDIKNTSMIELLLAFCDARGSVEYTLALLKDIQKISNTPSNLPILLDHKIFIGWLIDTAFANFKSKDIETYNIFHISLRIYVEMLYKAILYASESPSSSVANSTFDKLSLSVSLSSASFPILFLENLFIWGNKTRTSVNENLLCDFISMVLSSFNEIFYPLTTPISNSKKTKQDLKNDPKNKKRVDFFNSNFRIFCTFLFNYYCFFKCENIINIKGLDLFKTQGSMIKLPEGFVAGMNFSEEIYDNLETFWKDYLFFNVINKHFSFIWSNENSFKILPQKKYKSQKEKYDAIVQEVILNKNQKNIFIHELVFLCKDVKLNGKDIEISLMKLFSISFAMIIINTTVLSLNQKEVKYWLKEYKHFIRFIILGSSNFTPGNTIEWHKLITDRSIDAIVFGLCFLKGEYNEREIHRESLKKTMTSLLCFCFLIVKEQLNYIESHKSILKVAFKSGRNDLVQCAVFRIFNEFALISQHQPILTIQKIKEYEAAQYANVIDEIDKEEWKEPLFSNKILKARIENSIFGISSFCSTCRERYNQIEGMRNEIDVSYQKIILSLVPSYEIDLEKYSNSSFITQKQKRNQYKIIKKQLFTWRGMWSDRDLFFNHISKLKMKIINHYTKYLAKPLLAPILDLNYYIPHFTEFTIDQMFRDRNKEDYQYDLDIDQIIKSKTALLHSSNAITRSSITASRENYLKEIYRKSSSELSSLYLKIGNKLDFRKDDEFIDIFQKSSTATTTAMTRLHDMIKKRKFYFCCFVKSSHHIKGVLFIEDRQLIFRVFMNQQKGNVIGGMNFEIKEHNNEDYDKDRQTCYGSFFVGHHKDKDLLTFCLPYDEIRFFLRKRYYYKKTGIEVFSKANKSYYFNFKSARDRESAISDLLSFDKEAKPIKNDLKDTKDEYDYIMGYETSTVHNKKLKKIRLSDKIAKWSNWDMSTFELLMWLNIYSNRSYSDLSQYPVMPWVLSDYSGDISLTDEKSYRDLSKPMGMLEVSDEAIARKELFIETYQTMKTDELETVTKAYFFGSHYSNPIYVANFLMRLFPFSHISIELQGHKFDNPDRLFLSVNQAFTNSTSMKTDIRELTPEFYYLPEIFRNINNLNLGELQNGEIVNDVSTPLNNNPYEFVLKMREALENSVTSFTIQKWIDLTFGYKQRGKEGELAQNLFIPSSYEDQIDIAKEENKEVLFHLVEFGLTPGQSLSKECPSRNKKELTSKHKEVARFNSNLVTFIAKSKSEKSIMVSNRPKAVKIVEKERMLVVLSNNIILLLKVNYSFIDTKYNFEVVKFNLALNERAYGKVSEFYSQPMSNHIVIFNKGRNVVFGGFYGGTIIILSIDSSIKPNVLKCTLDQSPTTAIVISKREDYAFCGDINGNVSIFRIKEDAWERWKQVIDHSGAITHIVCKEELNLWASASNDGFVNIYTMPACKIIRVIVVKDECIDYVFLSACPLPSVIVYSSTSFTFHVYSINGENLKRDECTNQLIKSPIMLKDIFFSDYLAYIMGNKIIILGLPLLIQIHCVVIQSDYPLCCLTASEDNQTLYAITEDGNSIVIIRDKEEEAEAKLNKV